jgi:hypothetical protein
LQDTWADSFNEKSREHRSVKRVCILIKAVLTLTNKYISFGNTKRSC